MFWNKSCWANKLVNCKAVLRAFSCTCVLLLGCVCIMLTSGCISTSNRNTNDDLTRNQLPQDPNLPKITDPRYRAKIPTPLSGSRGKRAILLRVSRLDFPLELKLNQALKHALPAGGPQIQTLLKDNGLRIDLLPIGEFKDFAKALGEPLSVERSNLSVAPDGTPLTTTSQIKDKITIDIHDPQQPKTFVTNRGWFRFMLTVQKIKLGSVELNIIPQHYQPRTSVKPRSVLDQIWDGTLFDMLKTTITLPSSHLLIISRTDRPTLAQYRQKNQPRLFDAEPGDNATRQENASMGDVLLTYDHWGHPAQMVFVIARLARH